MQQCQRLLQFRGEDNLLEPATVSWEFLEVTSAEPAGRAQEPGTVPASDSESIAAEEDTSNQKDLAKYDSRLLRRTASLHDDYLHRGSFLRALDFYTYAARVKRVRKPRTSATRPVAKHLFFL